jgi:transposase
MKIVDTKASPPGAPFRVRTNRTGRRTYSREYKLEIVEECSAPGVSVAAVALSHRINANLVRRWIVQCRARRLYPTLNTSSVMLPVTVEPSARLVPPVRGESAPGPSKNCAGVIEIELEAARIRVRGTVDASALRTVLDVLAKP